jgi:hypothetical protein
VPAGQLRVCAKRRSSLSWSGAMSERSAIKGLGPFSVTRALPPADIVAKWC